MRILGTHHCGKELCKAFKCRVNLHHFLCLRDYEEQVVSSFAHQIQSEYYGDTISVFIEGIALKHFSASHQPIPLLASDHVSRKAVFHYFLSDYSKQDATNTSEHSKRIIELFHNRTVAYTTLPIRPTRGCTKEMTMNGI